MPATHVLFNTINERLIFVRVYNQILHRSTPSLFTVRIRVPQRIRTREQPKDVPNSNQLSYTTEFVFLFILNFYP